MREECYFKSTKSVIWSSGCYPANKHNLVCWWRNVRLQHCKHLACMQCNQAFTKAIWRQSDLAVKLCRDWWEVVIVKTQLWPVTTDQLSNWFIIDHHTDSNCSFFIRNKGFNEPMTCTLLEFQVQTGYLEEWVALQHHIIHLKKSDLLCVLDSIIQGLGVIKGEPGHPVVYWYLEKVKYLW